MAFKNLNKIGIKEVQFTVAYLTGKLIDEEKASIIMETLEDVVLKDGELEAPSKAFINHLQRFYPTELIKMKFDCSKSEEALKKVAHWVERNYSDLEDIKAESSRG